MNELSAKIPGYARDLRLNLDSVLTRAGAPGLSERQIWMVAVASAIASRHAPLVEATVAEASKTLDATALSAARSAAAIMAMNNVYYRFTHLLENDDYSPMPARLRMNVVDNPGVAKIEFELACMAVSAINGCGTCMTSHEKILRRHLVSAEAVQSSVRIASVLHAVAVTLEQDQPAAELAQAA